MVKLHDSKIDLSIIVVGYNMPRQLENTLHTLSKEYQEEVDEYEYEVIVIENNSVNNLPKSTIDNLPANFSYYLRHEKSRSPARALNEGLKLAKGRVIGMMIDGAHLLSPGVIKFARMAFSITSDAFVAVPVFHLGYEEQDISSAKGYNEDVERELLNQTNWRENGYKLFDISVLCSANENGFLAPIMESNCFFSSMQAFEEIGCVDETFELPGGGALNLHLTRQLGIRKSSEYFMLASEGTFHQYHGGVTSSANRQNVVEEQSQQLRNKWNGEYRLLTKNPIVLGKFRPESHKALEYSVKRIIRRISNCKHKNIEVWPDDQDQF